MWLHCPLLEFFLLGVTSFLPNPVRSFMKRVSKWLSQGTYLRVSSLKVPRFCSLLSRVMMWEI